MYSACVSSWIRELVRQATPKSHGQQAIERDDGRPRLRIGPVGGKTSKSQPALSNIIIKSHCFYYYLVGLLMVDQASQVSKVFGCLVTEIQGTKKQWFYGLQCQNNPLRAVR